MTVRTTIGLIILLFSLSVPVAHSEVNLRSSSAPFAGKRAILEGDIPLWVDKDYLDRALRRIKEAGFNVYMPTVWQGRGTTWPSKHAPWDTSLSNHPKTNFDPLRYLIHKAHSLDIEVHPWFALTLRQSDIFPELALPELPTKAFNIHNSEFRDLMLKLVEEVVSNYDIDGVNLDYVRAVGLCLSAKCQDEYKKTYDRSLESDSFLFKVFPEAVPTLGDYQEAAVSSLVAGISDVVRRKKPHALITADVFVGHAPPSQGQNSVGWVNNGLLDVLLRMDYSRQINVASMDATRRELKNPTRQSLLISNMSNPAELSRGQKPYARDGKWLAETVSMILDRWPDTGIAIYFYKYLTDEQIMFLKNGPFRVRKTSTSAASNLRSSK